MTDPAAAAVYALIEDDKTPDPIPAAPTRQTTVRVWRTLDKITGEDVTTVTGLSPEQAATLADLLDRVAYMPGGPPPTHIDPVRFGLRRVLEEDAPKNQARERATQ